MKNEKTKVLVVFEDGREPLETVAKGIKASLADSASVKARSASDVAVAEILAAEAYLFGVRDSGAPSWAELKRLLTGMNLAGRKAGFFVERKGAADGLKAAFAPSELVTANADYLLDKADASVAWAKGLLAAKK